jgi:hypothetical protein
MYFIMVLPPSFDQKEITEGGKRHDEDQTNGSAILMLIESSALIADYAPDCSFCKAECFSSPPKRLREGGSASPE